MTAASPKPRYHLLGERVRARIRAVWSFSEHRTIVGGAVERALLEVLREMLPRQFEPLTGIIARSDGELCTRQIDVMIVDTLRYPVLMRDGDFAVVLPESVRATIEVKSSQQDKTAVPLRDTLVQVALTSSEVFDPIDGGSLMRFCFFDDRHAANLTAAKKAIEQLVTDPAPSQTATQLAAAVEAAEAKLAEAKKRDAKDEIDEASAKPDNEIKVAEQAVEQAAKKLEAKQHFEVGTSNYLPTAVFASSGLRLRLVRDATPRYEIWKINGDGKDDTELFCDALVSLIRAIIEFVLASEKLGQAFSKYVGLDDGEIERTDVELRA
jgi:hypothetical protein